MKKGNIVTVKAQVVTRYKDLWGLGEMIYSPPDGNRMKCLYRLIFKEPWTGMVVGRSYLATGYYQQGGDYWDGDYPTLREEKRHPVWLIEPNDSARWVKPFPCLETDLELVDPTGDR